MKTLNEKQMLDDVLMTNDLLSRVYNSYLPNCVNQSVRNDFVNILSDLQKMCADAADERKKRGWYSEPNVPVEVARQLVDKFSAKA